MSTPQSPSPADLEQLAALADGRLTGAARVRLLERLTVDEGLREVYAETLAFQEEYARVAPVAEAGRSEGRSRPRWPWIVLPLAAAAAWAVIALGPWRAASGGDLRLARLVEPIAARAVGEFGDAWYEQNWRVMRGPEELPASPEDGWFRVGVRVIETDLALARGLDDAVVLSHRTEALLEVLEPFGGHHLLLAEARLDLERTGDPAPLREALAVVDRIASERAETARHYRLGRWAEAGRLAAHVGALDVLERRAFRGAGAAPWVTDPERRARLDRIAAALDSPLDEAARAELAESFARLIALH